MNYFTIRTFSKDCCSHCNKSFDSIGFLKGLYPYDNRRVFEGPLYWFGPTEFQIIFCSNLCSNQYHWSKKDKDVDIIKD
jgi:hypothetical protein